MASPKNSALFHAQATHVIWLLFSNINHSLSSFLFQHLSSALICNSLDTPAPADSHPSNFAGSTLDEGARSDPIEPHHKRLQRQALHYSLSFLSLGRLVDN
jgi:hypothetical protein